MPLQYRYVVFDLRKIDADTDCIDLPAGLLLLKAHVHVQLQCVCLGKDCELKLAQVLHRLLIVLGLKQNKDPERFIAYPFVAISIVACLNY